MMLQLLFKNLNFINVPDFFLMSNLSDNPSHIIHNQKQNS